MILTPYPGDALKLIQGSSRKPEGKLSNSWLVADTSYNNVRIQGIND